MEIDTTPAPPYPNDDDWAARSNVTLEEFEANASQRLKDLVAQLFGRKN